MFDGKLASATNPADGNLAETSMVVADDQSGWASIGEPSLTEAVIDVSGSGDVENVTAENDCVSPSPSPSSFGCSLKRMLSRSKSENKVFNSSV